jgi:hypothetical protein
MWVGFTGKRKFLEVREASTLSRLATGAGKQTNLGPTEEP